MPERTPHNLLPRKRVDRHQRSVINNVNASPKMLNTLYIKKVKVLADMFRDYGIKVYLSVNFASPMAEGGLKTATR